MDQPAEHPLDATRRILADADSSASADDILERDAEVADRISVTWGRMTVADRLEGALGEAISADLVVPGEQPMRVYGVVTDVGVDWCLVGSAAGPIYFSLSSLLSINGLGTRATDPDNRSPLMKSRTWIQALRSLMGGPVKVTTVDGRTRSGFVTRVGSDHFDIASRGASFGDDSAAVTCVPHSALLAIRTK